MDASVKGMGRLIQSALIDSLCHVCLSTLSMLRYLLEQAKRAEQSRVEAKDVSVKSNRCISAPLRTMCPGFVMQSSLNSNGHVT